MAEIERRDPESMRAIFLRRYKSAPACGAIRDSGGSLKYPEMTVCLDAAAVQRGGPNNMFGRLTLSAAEAQRTRDGWSFEAIRAS